MIYSSGGVLRVRGGNRVATPSPSLSVWGASSTAARGVPDGDPIKRLKNFYVFYLLQMGSPAQKSEKTECSVSCSMTDNCCSVAGPRPLSSLPLQVLTAALDLHVTADRNIQNPQTSRRFDAVSAYIVVISVYCERRTT